MVTTATKPQPTTPADIPDTGVPPLVLTLSPAIQMTEEQFAHFCELNPNLRIERTRNGELEIMAPVFSETGGKEGEIFGQLWDWSKKDGSGRAYGPSAGFTLPNGAIREPDASWISRTRLQALTPEQRSGFYNICPDFVIELRSDTDRLSVLQAKMEEYIANGAQLGLLIDPRNARVHTYRPGSEPEILERPDSLSCDPILPRFTLDLQPIWEQPDWLPPQDPEGQD